MFSAALKKFGPYGCAHETNEGLDYTSSADNFAATTLPTGVSFSYDEGLQWNNCDYEGTEAASVDGTNVTVTLTRDGAKVTFTGTCVPQPPTK